MMTSMDINTETRVSHFIVRAIVMTSVVAIMSLFTLAPVEASSDRVTRGDAEAVLHAFGNGGEAILSHHLTHLGGPSDELRAGIRPFSGSAWDGRHFCAEDWHAILIADFEGGDKSFTVQDARAIMDQIVFELILDGSALPTERTAIHRLLATEILEFFGWEKAYVFQQGEVLPPSALTVGSHTLKVVATGPFPGTDQITFFIDAPGTGACL